MRGADSASQTGVSVQHRQLRAWEPAGQAFQAPIVAREHSAFGGRAQHSGTHALGQVRAWAHSKFYSYAAGATSVAALSCNSGLARTVVVARSRRVLDDPRLELSLCLIRFRTNTCVFDVGFELSKGRKHFIPERVPRPLTSSELMVHFCSPTVKVAVLLMNKPAEDFNRKHLTSVNSKA